MDYPAKSLLLRLIKVKQVVKQRELNQEVVVSMRIATTQDDMTVFYHQKPKWLWGTLRTPRGLEENLRLRIKTLLGFKCTFALLAVRIAFRKSCEDELEAM